jgi:hypothetical protein
MLFITYGTDRASQKTYINKLREKNHQHVYLLIERGDFTRNALEQTIFGKALFGESHLVVLDGVTELVENREYLETVFEEIEKSDNIVIIQDSKLPVDFIIGAQNITKEVVEYKEPTEAPDFSLWSAFYARDKKLAWQSYLKISLSEASEKTHAGLLGQVRNMYKIKMAAPGTTWKDLGFSKDTSYHKARLASNKFSESELGDMLYDLTAMFGRAHAGEIDFKLALESFILKYS